MFEIGLKKVFQIKNSLTMNHELEEKIARFYNIQISIVTAFWSTSFMFSGLSLIYIYIYMLKSISHFK